MYAKLTKTRNFTKYENKIVMQVSKQVLNAKGL